LFAYLTQSSTEAELDEVLSAMTLDGYMARIACPVLLAAGEYDPRSPLDEVYRMFDQLTAPAELWVFADQHHMPSIGGTESAGTPQLPCMASCVTGSATVSPTSRCVIPARYYISSPIVLGPIAQQYPASGSGTSRKRPW
jgi:hypothetical protein